MTHNDEPCSCGCCNGLAFDDEDDEILAESAHDHAHEGCDCGCEEGEEEELLDLRFINEHQIACSGGDLIDMLNCDEGVSPELYTRLHLTPHTDDSLGFEYTFFDELKDDAFYMISFPDGTDFQDFSIAQALALEEISEKCFNDLAMEESELSCDGDCETCPQECIGKLPVE